MKKFLDKGIRLPERVLRVDLASEVDNSLNPVHDGIMGRYREFGG